MHDRAAVASECLRQLWQIIDRGGRSMGRTREATLLETAIDLLDYDYKYADLADNDPTAFEKIREDTRWAASSDRTKKHFESMNLE